MILSELSKGDVGVFSCVNAPDDQLRRASHMGIIRGVKFEVFSKCGGDMVIIVMGVKLAVGRKLAALISVIPQGRAQRE